MLLNSLDSTRKSWWVSLIRISRTEKRIANPHLDKFKKIKTLIWSGLRVSHIKSAVESAMGLIRRDTGKGLIILLHGAPGVGKTSTAGESTR